MVTDRNQVQNRNDAVFIDILRNPARIAGFPNMAAYSNQVQDIARMVPIDIPARSG